MSKYTCSLVKSAHFAEMIIRMKNITSENITISSNLRGKENKVFQ